jgi:hypothetical protein
MGCVLNFASAQTCLSVQNHWENKKIKLRTAEASEGYLKVKAHVRIAAEINRPFRVEVEFTLPL